VARGEGGRLERICRVSQVLPNPVREVRIAAAGGAAHTFGPCAAGEGCWLVRAPYHPEAASVTFEVRADGAAEHAEARLEPVRPWMVHLIQHSHTDLGYTDLQEDTTRGQAGFLDEVIELARQTRDWPDEARLRWVCESAWAVERFLESAPPEQVQALKELIREGTVEMTGLWWQFTEMCSHAEWARSLEWARKVARALEAPARTALNCDVNGWSWSLPQLLREAGIERFATAINGYRGGMPEPCPRPFWWESPDGSRVLVWNGLHYHAGNALGAHEGLPVMEERLPRHLQGLVDDGYPYCSVNLQHSGLYADNCGPRLTACEIARDWNQRYASPVLRTATLCDFFEALERELPEHPAPVWRGDWTDWWADGNATAPREVAMNRASQQTLRAADTVWALRGLAGDSRAPEKAAALDACLREAATFDEHTFGAAASVSKPWSPLSLAQWASKASHAYRASVRSARLWDDAIAHPALTGVPGPALVVLNPDAWDRRDIVQARVDVTRLPNGRDLRLIGPGGRTAPHQLVGESEGAVDIVFAADVPACGYSVYAIEPAQAWDVSRDRCRPESENYYWSRQEALGTDAFECRFHPLTGTIESLRHIPTGREALARGGWDALDVIHERPHQGRVALEIGRANRGFARQAFDRTQADWKLTHADAGPVFCETVRRGELPGVTRLEQRVRLFRELGFAEVLLEMDKLPSREPEAFYLAFPLAAEEGWEVSLDKPLTWFTAEREQLPGCARDWYTAASWVRAGGKDASVALAVPDAPMLQIGGINTGKWLSELPPHGGLVMSWLYNNYWTTNFPASAHGPLRFRYRLAVLGGDADEATRFGWEAASPLRAVFTGGSGGEETEAPARAGCFEVRGEGVFAFDVRPAETGKAAIVLLWNVTDGAQEFMLNLNLPGVRVSGAWVCDADGGAVRPLEISAQSARGSIGARATLRMRIETEKGNQER